MRKCTSCRYSLNESKLKLYFILLECLLNQLSICLLLHSLEWNRPCGINGFLLTICKSWNTIIHSCHARYIDLHQNVIFFFSLTSLTCIPKYPSPASEFCTVKPFSLPACSAQGKVSTFYIGHTSMIYSVLKTLGMSAVPAVFYMQRKMDFFFFILRSVISNAVAYC